MCDVCFLLKKTLLGFSLVPHGQEERSQSHKQSACTHSEQDVAALFLRDLPTPAIVVMVTLQLF